MLSPIKPKWVQHLQWNEFSCLTWTLWICAVRTESNLGNRIEGRCWSFRFFGRFSETKSCCCPAHATIPSMNQNEKQMRAMPQVVLPALFSVLFSIPSRIQIFYFQNLASLVPWPFLFSCCSSSTFLHFSFSRINVFFLSVLPSSSSILTIFLFIYKSKKNHFYFNLSFWIKAGFFLGNLLLFVLYGYLNCVESFWAIQWGKMKVLLSPAIKFQSVLLILLVTWGCFSLFF